MKRRSSIVSPAKGDAEAPKSRAFEKTRLSISRLFGPNTLVWIKKRKFLS